MKAMELQKGLKLHSLHYAKQKKNYPQKATQTKK
jgi:hypothetical protein